MQLVETLVRRGLVSDAQFNHAESLGGDVLASLVGTGAVSHEAALEAMADEVGSEQCPLPFPLPCPINPQITRQVSTILVPVREFSYF